MGDDRIGGVSSPSGPLVDLAHAYGVMTEYVDFRGSQVQVSAETIEAVLAAMDVDVADPADALADKELDGWRRMVPPCLVTVQGQDAPAGCTWSTATRPGSRSSSRTGRGGGWTRSTAGSSRATSTAPGSARRRSRCPGDLPLGYHTLHASSDDSKVTGTLIVTPGLARAPGRRGRRPELGVRRPALQRPVRAARGASATCTTSARSPTWSAGLGADYVLVNPLHAAEPLPPLEPSPYLPVEPALLQPALPPGRGHPGVRRAATGPARDARPDPRAGARRARRDSAIERDAAWSAKLAALLLVHDVERSPERARAFAEFRAREGDALLQFATWSVLAEDHGNDARDWPEELRDIGQPGGRRPARCATSAGSASRCGCSGCSTSSCSRRRPRRSRPACGSAPCTTWRSACTPAARTRGGCRDVYAGGRPGRRAAGPLQPARPELEPAAVAPGPARRARLRSRSAT